VRANGEAHPSLPTLAEPQTAPGRVVVLLPVLDEVGTIRSLVESIFATGCVDAILVIDDDSKDGTRDELERAKERFPELDVVVRRNERGLGTALLLGFTEALGRYNFDRLVVMDADLSHDSAAIPQLLAVPADLVIGSRYYSGGGIKNWPATRRIISFVANYAARHLLRLPVRDVTSGFRVYSRRLVRKIVAEAACGGYEFQVEAVWLAAASQFSVEESPIEFVERRAGKSKLATWDESWKFLRFVIDKSLLRGWSNRLTPDEARRSA